jgi:DNA-binding response OmpR family regulator
MMTGLRTEADVRLSLSLGAQGYLAKPFAPTDLISRVDRLLSPKIPTKR